MDTLDFVEWKEPLHATSNENVFQYISISIIYMYILPFKSLGSVSIFFIILLFSKYALY